MSCYLLLRHLWRLQAVHHHQLNSLNQMSGRAVKVGQPDVTGIPRWVEPDCSGGQARQGQGGDLQQPDQENSELSPGCCHQGQASAAPRLLTLLPHLPSAACCDGCSPCNRGSFLLLLLLLFAVCVAGRAS